MSAILGHVGAWAPRAEQVATVALLDDPAACSEFSKTFMAGITRRLEALHAGFQKMKSAGRPVDSIAPMGGIYLTVHIHPFGRKTASGAPLKTNEEIRKWLLDTAQIGIVPFQAFGAPDDSGWFRLSVGAVSEADIAEALPRLEAALASLRRGSRFSWPASPRRGSSEEKRGRRAVRLEERLARRNRFASSASPAPARTAIVTTEPLARGGPRASIRLGAGKGRR